MDRPEPTRSDLHRSGYVALVGKPNVGKSTLMNALVGQKLSIVTRKPQTTRQRVLGILSGNDFQIIFLDTPGIIKPRYGLHRSMMKTVKSAVADADLIVFLVDATDTDVDADALEHVPGPSAILAINKMDLIDHRMALPLVEKYSQAHAFETVVPISAKTAFQVDVLLDEIKQRLPLGPPFYPQEMLSEQPERFFVAEIVREKIFERYAQEIPYSTQVNVISFTEESGKKPVIDADIIVERQSQKGIVIGKKGAALKAVGTAARKDIEEFLGRAVFLRLFVKVRSDWRDSEAHLRSFGYDDSR